MQFSFEVTANNQYMYGVKGALIPAMFGRLSDLTDPTGDSPLAFLITTKPYEFKRNYKYVFYPIYAFSVKEDNTMENFFIGVDVINMPTETEIKQNLIKIRDFIKKNFTIGGEGNGLAAAKLLESFII